MSQTESSRPRVAQLRRAVGRAASWARHESERYVWHEIELSQARRMESRMVDDMDLRPATTADLPALEQLGVPDLSRFDEFSARGGVLWVGETPQGIAIAFWILHTGMPLYPWLELPEDTVAFEHTTVSKEIRGLGYAPVALSAKFVELHEAGVRTAVTKIIDDNRPSLKSARRLGFRPTCLMYQRRTAGRTRTVVEAWTPFARHLAREVDAPGIAARDER